MALAPPSAAFFLPTADFCPAGSARPHSFRWLPPSDRVKIRSIFVTGSPLVAWKPSSRKKSVCKASLISIRCEQSTKEGNSLDVWLGRLAMVGFAVAIGVEIGTGKGLLENFGLTSPLPTVALALTALVGVLTAVFIFQSASKE